MQGHRIWRQCSRWLNQGSTNAHILNRIQFNFHLSNPMIILHNSKPNRQYICVYIWVVDSNRQCRDVVYMYVFIYLFILSAWTGLIVQCVHYYFVYLQLIKMKRRSNQPLKIINLHETYVNSIQYMRVLSSSFTLEHSFAHNKRDDELFELVDKNRNEVSGSFSCSTTERSIAFQIRGKKNYFIPYL